MTKVTKTGQTIQLDEHYSVSVSADCWTLKYENVIDQNGKLLKSRDETFHNSLSQALKKYLDSSVKPSGSVKEVIEVLGRIESKIDLLGRVQAF